MKLVHIKNILGLWPLVVGLTVLTGWASNSYILKRIIDSPIPMNPTTAVLFIILGITILTDYKPRIVLPAILITLVFSLFKLFDIFYHTSFYIDSFIFTSKLASEPAFPNRIAPNTALDFFLISIALIALRSSKQTGIMLGQSLLFLAMVVSLFAFVGYVFSIKSFYGVGVFTPMALITAITFFITSCGLLINKIQEGFLRFVFNDGPSGHMAKYLLPASLALPVLLGWLRLWGQRQGYYDPEFGVALSVMINVILLFSTICLSGYFLFRTDFKRKFTESELKYLALHDPLTGLITRRVFIENLKRRISLAQRREKDCYAVFYLDVDGLKQVNDQLGHQAGDELLIMVAQLLKCCTRSSDSVTRIGGDEFVILFEELEKGSEDILAERILQRMPKAFKTDKGEVPTGISIGITTPSKIETNPDNIIRAADEALYESKISGKNRFTKAKSA